jgi:hypothetical protein
LGILGIIFIKKNIYGVPSNFRVQLKKEGAPNWIDRRLVKKLFLKITKL